MPGSTSLHGIVIDIDHVFYMLLLLLMIVYMLLLLVLTIYMSLILILIVYMLLLLILIVYMLLLLVLTIYMLLILILIVYMLSSPRAKRAGPKGPRAESARAVTGRRCPHSGVG